ncbi:hypothetical protein FACS1894139_16930 [Planctomycetales bacterium]|nr:hypothetical protein FACS1894107_16790 [Planctomycetales bacterium]GHS99703.1 hypothetical protein FACS1894108_10190 [Planctomycetales bacterium]GHT07912.1 hypothetical protein FACS1894139_16930 [Planctomycetales bacterium]
MEFDEDEFAWSEWKNRVNRRKHGISFEEAVEIFADPHLLEVPDEAHSINEERYICYGCVDDLLLAVVIADTGEQTRIISARRAEPHEEKVYYAHYRAALGGN